MPDGGRRIGIVGAGAWGTALSWVARRAGSEVVLWAHRPETAETIRQRRANPDYLPGIALDATVRATSDLADVAACDALLMVVPAQVTREIGAAIQPMLRPDTPVAICSKGIEQGTGALMSEVVGAVMPGRAMAVLSGPTFAMEVARGLPTAVTIASRDGDTAQVFGDALGGPHFRPYRSDDVVDTEIAGAMKNVMAIACGVTDGRGLGENARAALITRGLAEMTRLCVAKGGRAETMMGLGGIGDLVLTCASEKSRNYALGVALGRGEMLESLMSGRLTVAEGVFSAPAAISLAASLGIEMPIAAAVDAILNREADIDAVIEGLLSRPFRDEA
jgi:glycerol-3-phosphate dehydrogenase (NAD(P)+)